MYWINPKAASGKCDGLEGIMKAAWYERNGAARDVLQYGEVDTPDPLPGEVRIRLAASGVNPTDVKNRRGRPLIGPRVIPHSDGAGIIDAVGPGVDRGRIGQRVWTVLAQWQRSSGTAAEYVSLPSAQAVKLPDNVDFSAGACLGVPALTAVHALRLLGDIAGKTILVTGAGSAVGHYATQIGKRRGARIVGTASAQKADHARGAGADFVIDYKSKDVAAVIKDLTRGKGVDAIVDMDLSSTARLVAAGALAANGTHICYGSNTPGDIPISFPAMLWGNLTLRFFVLYEVPIADRQAAIADLEAMLKGNELRHAIGAHFSLRDIVAAHEAVEAGQTVGNVVIDIV
jgi:NADPH2:quinone reductase